MQCYVSRRYTMYWFNNSVGDSVLSETSVITIQSYYSGIDYTPYAVFVISAAYIFIFGGSAGDTQCHISSGVRRSDLTSLYITRLIYFITGNLHLLTPFIFLAHFP